MSIAASLRRAVTRRAHSRCEYCQLSQDGQEATFHIDHVLPVAVGGLTLMENLALACVSCSLRKGAKQRALDPETGHEVPLFNPRTDTWTDHFRWEGTRVVPLSAVGRASAAALQLNRALALAIREAEAGIGRHPPAQADRSSGP